MSSYRSTNRRPDKSEMYKTRIILKNLVYIIGLAPEISEEEVRVFHAGTDQR